MIIINDIKVNDNNEKSCLIFQVFENNIEKNVFFEVEKKYKKYLCYERADAIVIGLLNYAMRKGLNIKSNIPITEDLLYNINTYLIPALCNSDYKLNPITIEAEIATALDNEDKIGTGLSCGIDSFHAIFNNINTQYKTFELTHLCINNVGAFNDCYKNVGANVVKETRYMQAEVVAKKLGLPLITSDSNFAIVFPQKHLLTHTYSSVFAVYCLQKLWGKYYYASSGKTFESFSLTKNSQKDSANYELLALNCFSHKNLKLYSEGGAINRLDKTKNIIDNEIVQNHLHVCIRESYNCNTCSKCMRTILTLYALDKLNDFKNVFDVNYFYKHKQDYIIWLLESFLKRDKMLLPIFKKLKKEITLFLIIKYILKSIFSFEIVKNKISIKFLFIKLAFKTKNA